MTTLLEKTRNITSILKRSEEKLAEELPYNAIADHLSAIIDCNSCIINSEGEVLGYHMNYETNNDRVEEFFQNKQFPERPVLRITKDKNGNLCEELRYIDLLKVHDVFIDEVMV